MADELDARSAVGTSQARPTQAPPGNDGRAICGTVLMHIHSKQPMLPQPTAPRPEKAPPAPRETLSVPRVSDPLSGGGGRRGGSPSRNPRGRSRPDEQSTDYDAAGAFAAKLVAFSLAALDGDTTPNISNDPPVSGSDLEALMSSALAQR